MGWLDDPCIDTIDGKLTETYPTAFPIELLAYIDGNSMLPDDVWITKLKEHLDGLKSIALFRKIWVYDRDEKPLRGFTKTR